MKKANIFCAILFVILNPIVVIIFSYIPANRIKLAADSAFEYFKENTLHNFSMKIIISVIISAIISLVVRAILLKRK